MYLDDVKLLKANLSVQSICVVLLALLSTVSVSSDAILNSVQLFVFVSSFFFPSSVLPFLAASQGTSFSMQ